MPKHSFIRLRAIPILDVARVLGLELKKMGHGIWNVKDVSDSKGFTSLTIFEKTNTWKRFSGKDFGGVSYGSTIDLVIHIRECPLRQAIEFLSSSFDV